MNWLPLRKNNVPLIDRQVEKVKLLHESLQKMILEGDIAGVQQMSELDLSVNGRKIIDKEKN